MQSFSIKQNDHLTEHELNELRNLNSVCCNHDGAASKVYWDIIKHKREIAGNFLCYRENILMGYLSFFLFDEDAVHVSAMVHPDHRRKKVFLNLLHVACTEIVKFNINKIKFSFPIKNKMAQMCLVALSGKFLYFEYMMERISPLTETIESNVLSIKQANKSDVELMASLDSICFKSDYEVMFQRFKNTINEPNRQTWLAYLGDECIGKAHIDFDKDKAFIHDVCIIPAKQKNGHGTILLKAVINRLINFDNCHQMNLEVAAENESALHLYKKCGFQIIDTYEYGCVNMEYLKLFFPAIKDHCRSI